MRLRRINLSTVLGQASDIYIVPIDTLSLLRQFVLLIVRGKREKINVYNCKRNFFMRSIFSEWFAHSFIATILLGWSESITRREQKEFSGPFIDLSIFHTARHLYEEMHLKCWCCSNSIQDEQFLINQFQDISLKKSDTIKELRLF